MTLSEPTAGLAIRLSALHGEIARLPGFAPLTRISVALYDHRTEILSTFAHSGEAAVELEYHQVPMAEVPSLAILATGIEPRVVDDLSVYGNSGSEHTLALRQAGLVSSLTFPVHRGEVFLGFVFFNATVKGFFTATAVRLLSPFSSAILDMAARELEKAGKAPLTLAPAWV